MKYLSLFSGIEAASVAWGPLGWEPLAFCEIEPFPSAVLAYHYPDTPNLGDVRTVGWDEDQRALLRSQEATASGTVARWTALIGKAQGIELPDEFDTWDDLESLIDEIEARLPGLFADVEATLTRNAHVRVWEAWKAANGSPDVLIAGAPCQAFSVAGKRGSLNDARGNLTLFTARLVQYLNPRFFLFENVPGILNTPDNAFGCLLGELVGAGEPCQPAGGRWSDAGAVVGPEGRLVWRVLDAQYFSVAQRRRRVFLARCPVGGADPADVLFEWDRLQRHTPPSREAREGAAGTAGRGFAAGSIGGYSEADTGGVVRAAGDDLGGGSETLVVGNSPICWGDVSRVNKRQNGPGFSDNGLAFTLSTADVPGVLVEPPPLVLSSGQAHAEIDHDLSPTLNCNRDGAPICVTGDHTHALTADGHDASEDGTGRGTPIVAEPYCMAPAFSKRPGQQIATRDDGLSYAVTTGEPPRVLDTIAYRKSARAQRSPEAGGFETWVEADAANTLNTFDVGERDSHAVISGYQVRRLLPEECETLQAFPVGYTSIPWRGKSAAKCPDGPRYKALGNSMCCNVIRWIGERIEGAAK